MQSAILGRLVTRADDRTLERLFTNRPALWLLFRTVAGRFNPSRSGGFAGELQCDLRRSGGALESWTIAVDGRRAAAQRRPASEPALVVTLDAVDLVRMATGELDPGSALLTGRLDVRGDFRLVMRMGPMFGGGRSA